jgi:nicotinate-nucleotide pyrophosphorylase (carboxylating)
VSSVVPCERARAVLDGELDRRLRAALDEDLGPGDVTTDTLVPADVRTRARLIARAHGIVAGLGAFARVFELLDSSARVQLALDDGARVAPDTVVAEVAGRARALLSGERTALNLVQRLSGIATLTARFVEACAGRVRVLDTRKTTPGWRALEKHAVRCGGGESHRFGLFDEAMVKNNHVDLVRRDLVALVGALRARHPALRITAEARDEREALAAIAGDADVVLLDNFAPEALAALCPRLRVAARGRARPLELEASGGITLANAARFAASGVDRVSIGALTHSAPALDLSLRLEAPGP